MDHTSMVTVTAFAMLAFAPGSASGQSAAEQVANSVLAAPEALQADATVITFGDDGAAVVVRQGNNGLVCWDSSDEPGQQGRFSAQCTSERNLGRVEQNHRIVNSGGS